ncbi:hypothetical protein LBMAG49_29950 [Planctomycetota bacterium]|nr:hypothetical protein LBMAG49_29950 [Planctomycetota bacterium]
MWQGAPKAAIHRIHDDDGAATARLIGSPSTTAIPLSHQSHSPDKLTIAAAKGRAATQDCAMR